MKYIPNPVEVDAFQIVAIDGPNVKLDRPGPTSPWETPTPEMCARMTPKVGDYWVVQSDGYVYLNPKEVFERKYRPAEKGTNA